MAMSTTFAAEQAVNRRNSILLVVAVMAVLAALGFTIGYGTSGALSGAYFVTGGAIVLATLLSVGSYFGGDKLVIATSSAREVDHTSAPQLKPASSRNFAAPSKRHSLTLSKPKSCQRFARWRFRRRQHPT